MRIFNIYIVLILLFSVFLFTNSCSDNGTDNKDDLSDAPQINVKTIDLPDGLKESTDYNAQVAVTYVSLANSMVAYSSWWNPPANAGSLAKVVETAENEWTYNWTVNNLEVQLIIKEVSDQIEWQTIYNGTDGYLTYNNFVFIDGEGDKQGDNGAISINDPQTQMPVSVWNWATDNSDYYTIDWSSYSEGHNEGRIKVGSNPDKSGIVEYYTEQVVIWKAQWTSAGSGSWWSFNTQGEQQETGTWD